MLRIHAMNRLDGVTVSGSADRRVALAARRICIGHSFLTQYSSHVICVPITQRLSARATTSRTQAPSLRFLFFPFLFLFLLICFARPRGTREGIYLVARAGFSAIFRPAAAVIGRLPRAVMNVEILASRTIIHEGLKVAT